MSNQTAYGFIHCHSEHSIKDSPLKIEDLCSQAKQMGANAVSLTDHGTCTGIIEFINTCNKYGLKPIPGVEAYVESYASNRAHLVLLAKNYAGYQEISRAITEANGRLENVGGVMLPIMSKQIIEKYFKAGNVIATSACIAGVLASILRSNEELHAQIEKLRKKQKKYSDPNDSGYLEGCKKLDTMDESIKRLMQEKNVAEALAKKSYKKRINALHSMMAVLGKDENESYHETKILLEQEMKESEEAKQKLPNIKKELEQTRRQRTLLNKKLKVYRESSVSFTTIQKSIEELESKLKSEEALIEMTKKEAEWYKYAFQGNFFIELQYHGIKEEAETMPILARIAQELRIPIIATNDVHIKDKAQAKARQFLCSLRFEQWSEIRPSDEELYMKSDQALYDSLCKILDKDIAKLAVYNIRRLCDSCHFEMPSVSHYPKYRDENGRIVADAAQLLREKAYEGAKRLYPNGVDTQRLEYELDTIISLGYADYLLIVADFINYAKYISRKMDETGVGYGVGPGRGSGAGSMVNYTIGITSIDPLKYGLIFERFLNKDRVSMPDIDTDFSDEVRDKAIDYVRKKYGEACVAGIRTCLTQGARASLRNSARLRGIELYPGSANKSTKEMQELRAIGDAMCNKIPQKPNVKLADFSEALSRICKDENSQVILERAMKAEGAIIGLSIHAAGIIIGDGTPLKDHVPLLYNTKKQLWAVQCDMVEAEEIGLLKMDFLGLKNLDIITECIRRIKKRTGITIDPDNLPFEAEVFREIFSKGKTSCVFQFESGGMKKMLREFKPESFEDIILLVAAYRPGPMDFIPDIIQAKHGLKKPSYIIPELEEILSPTYGYPIYQEQLMDIFHKCAGFSLGEADIIRRYMSKKKVDKFLAYKDQFINGMVEHGAATEDANNFWESLVNFSKYAFNKSHAACYAQIAYSTAWLKHHYPTEYMCAVMNHALVKKIPALLHECHEMGIQVLAPDINKSFDSFVDSNGKIIYGLNAIKGIDAGASMIIQERKENGFYASFSDFMIRAHKTTAITEKLIRAGAFSCFDCGGRDALLSVLPTYTKCVSNIKKKQQEASKLLVAIQQAETAKDKEQLKKKYKLALENIEKYKAQYQSVAIPPSAIDDKLSVLEDEKELLGAYISGHPLDSYAHVFREKSICLIDDFETGFHWYAGIITNIKLTNRKSDGKEMAFFTLEDTTGEIQACCFTEAYEKYHELIEEGKVVKIYAKGIEEDNGFGKDEDPVRKLVIQKMFKCRARKKPIFLSVPDMQVFRNEIFDKLQYFIDEDSHPVYLHDQSTGDIEAQQFTLKSDVMETEIPDIYIKALRYFGD